MEKEFFKSKGVWSGVLLIIIALYTMFTNGTIDPATLTTLFTGSGIIGVRQAVK